MRRNSPRTSVTLADVAALAGVSTSTASLAYRSTGSITPATRARILRAAASIGYAGPDPTARSLKSGRSGIVGVVVAGSIRRAFQNPVALATMAGLSEALDDLDVGQLLLPGRREPREGSAPLLEGMPVDAVVFLTRGERWTRSCPGSARVGSPWSASRGRTGRAWPWSTSTTPAAWASSRATCAPSATATSPC